MMAQVWLGSFFLVCTWQTKRMYMTSLNLSCGTADLWMKVIVFVPCMPLLSPCANQPNSFAAEIFQAALNLGWCRSTQHSSRSPFSWSRTGWAAVCHCLATCSAILSLGICSWQHALTWLAMLSVADGCLVDQWWLLDNQPFNGGGVGIHWGATTLGALVMGTLGSGGMYQTVGGHLLKLILGIFGGESTKCCYGSNDCLSCCKASKWAVPFEFGMPWIAFVKSWYALTMASAGVTVGWAGYLCLK